MKGLLAGSLLIGIAFGATTYPIVEPDLLQEIESRKAVLQKKFLEAVAKSQGKALKPPEGWSVALPFLLFFLLYFLPLLFFLADFLPEPAPFCILVELLKMFALLLSKNHKRNEQKDFPHNKTFYS